MSNGFKAVFFDMDGIIVDSMPYHFISWFEALRKYNIHLNPILIFEMEGAKWVDIVEPSFKKANKVLTPEITAAVYFERQKLLKKYFKRYIFGGISEFIKSLKYQNILVGLVTGSSRKEVQNILPVHLFESFETIVSGDSVKHGKPHPESYLTAVNNLKVKPEDCLVIENAPFGIKAAKSAGITCYAVATSLPKRYLLQADEIFENHEKLYEKFNENNFFSVVGLKKQKVYE
ncbi:MAG: HAD family phosphatase [Endomicrobium sp.]|jgi:HAD superfamily hydrolase (TIGR01509 family)|nr:HAD family phosphatase [Endomicrobium sp.]